MEDNIQEVEVVEVETKELTKTEHLKTKIQEYTEKAESIFNAYIDDPICQQNFRNFPDKQKVIALLEIEGYPQAEIARGFDITPPSVYAYRKKAEYRQLINVVRDAKLAEYKMVIVNKDWQYASDALDMIYKIMKESKDWKMKFQAAQYLADRVSGETPQPSNGGITIQSIQTNIKNNNPNDTDML